MRSGLRQKAHAKAEKCKWRFFGAHRVAMMSPYKRATSYEPLRDRNPTFAVGKGNREAFFVAVSKLRDFRRSYCEALAREIPPLYAKCCPATPLHL